MQFMVLCGLLRNSVSTEEWLAATTFMKYCTLKKLFPTINYKEKMFFSLFLRFFTYYFIKIFVHPSVIAAVCYFSVYKLIGWVPTNLLLVKGQQQDTKKGVNYVQS